MIERYFTERQNLRGDLKIPHTEKDCGYPGDVGKAPGCCSVINPNYVDRSHVFVPYIPGHINIVPTYGRDVISAPFSGCLLATFVFEGDCLFEDCTDVCPHHDYFCQDDCPFSNVELAAHVAYEPDQNITCKALWEDKMLRRLNNVNSFSPIVIVENNMDEVLRLLPNDRFLIVYGIITARKQCHVVCGANTPDTNDLLVCKVFPNLNRSTSCLLL